MTTSSPDTDVSSGRRLRPAAPAGARLAYDRTERASRWSGCTAKASPADAGIRSPTPWQPSAT